MATQHTHSTVIPCLRYRNAPAAIEALCNVIGFERHLVVPGEDPSIIVHSQLRLASGGMIMLGSHRDRDENEYGKLMAQPDQTGGRETQTPYVVVPDADAVYARAKAAPGWRILIEIADQSYGGRLFTAADAEGHVWSIGSYDPWAS